MTVLDHAEKLLGRVPVLHGKTDAQIKGVVVAELCQVDDLASKPDAFVESAFHVLISGDSRMAVMKRQLRLDTAKRQAAQYRRQSDAQPAGNA
jgi:hypothetical protein